MYPPQCNRKHFEMYRVCGVRNENKTGLVVPRQQKSAPEGVYTLNSEGSSRCFGVGQLKCSPNVVRTICVCSHDIIMYERIYSTGDNARDKVEQKGLTAARRFVGLLHTPRPKNTSFAVLLCGTECKRYGRLNLQTIIYALYSGLYNSSGVRACRLHRLGWI